MRETRSETAGYMVYCADCGSYHAQETAAPCPKMRLESAPPSPATPAPAGESEGLAAGVLRDVIAALWTLPGFKHEEGNSVADDIRSAAAALRALEEERDVIAGDRDEWKALAARREDRATAAERERDEWKREADRAEVQCARLGAVLEDVLDAEESPCTCYDEPTFFCLRCAAHVRARRALSVPSEPAPPQTGADSGETPKLGPFCVACEHPVWDADRCPNCQHPVGTAAPTETREALERVARRLESEREEAAKYIRSGAHLYLTRAEMDTLAALLSAPQSAPTEED